VALRAAEENGMMSTASIVSCVWDDGTMGRWDDGTMGRWDDGMMGRWDDGLVG
jgi:hypothetical protein